MWFLGEQQVQKQGYKNKPLIILKVHRSVPMSQLLEKVCHQKATNILFGKVTRLGNRKNNVIDDDNDDDKNDDDNDGIGDNDNISSDDDDAWYDIDASVSSSSFLLKQRDSSEKTLESKIGRNYNKPNAKNAAVRTSQIKSWQRDEVEEIKIRLYINTSK